MGTFSLSCWGSWLIAANCSPPCLFTASTLYRGSSSVWLGETKPEALFQLLSDLKLILFSSVWTIGRPWSQLHRISHSNKLTTKRILSPFLIEPWSSNLLIVNVESMQLFRAIWIKLDNAVKILLIEVRNVSEVSDPICDVAICQDPTLFFRPDLVPFDV